MIMAKSTMSGYKKEFEKYSGIKQKTLGKKFTTYGVDPQIRNAVMIRVRENPCL